MTGMYFDRRAVRHRAHGMGLALAALVLLGLAGDAAAQTQEAAKPADLGHPAPVSAVPSVSADVHDTQSAARNPMVIDGVEITVRPPARSGYVPRTRWQHMEGNALWTRAAMSALKNHGSPLVKMVPRDITDWCPAYAQNNAEKRSAFWVGYMSALAKYESTYKPRAVGGGGRWYGLLQILPATARGYECAAGTGEALKSGPANLSCAVRIMTYTVKRDGVIHGRDSKWRGVSADWGPMRNEAKRTEMATWLKRQNYCKPVNSLRPRARP